MLLSICMITYGHESYIRQAIESVLMQETNFDFELIVANDCSPDTTNLVIKGIIANHPKGNIIQYYNHSQNIGMIPNLIFALQKCEGKYIALCEGDDYWTDPLKLQKQVDFLEKNNDYSGVATNSMIVYENSASPNVLFRKSGERTLELNELLETRPFHTATFLFKKTAYKFDFPFNILSADRALFMLIACSGKIKLLPDVTAVYRKNDGGISRSVTSTQMSKDYNIGEYISKYNKDFDYYKLQSFIAYTVFGYSNKIYLHDYIVNSFLLIYYRLRKTGKKFIIATIQSSAKLIAKSAKKVSLI